MEGVLRGHTTPIRLPSIGSCLEACRVVARTRLSQSLSPHLLSFFCSDALPRGPGLLLVDAAKCMFEARNMGETFGHCSRKRIPGHARLPDHILADQTVWR